jgi:parallel beta-helix repeat protein
MPGAAGRFVLSGERMSRLIYKWISFLIAFAFAFGSYAGVSASPEQAATGKTFIVDKNNVGGHGCKNAWPGTLAQPLCSIPSGIAKMKPGDTLLIRRGTYPSFEIKKSGAAGKYLTISGYKAERPLIKGGEGIKLVGTAYVRVRQLEVTGADAGGDYMGGITITPSSSVDPHHNIVEKNKVHHNTAKNMSGIKIADGSHNKVLNNVVYNNYFAGIRVVSNSAAMTGNEIGFNRVYNQTLAGGDSDGIGLYGDDLTNTYIHDNIVYGNSDDGIDTWNTSGNIIERNVVYNQKGTGDGNGIKVGGSSTGGDNLVRNNVSYNNKSNGFHSNGSGGNTYYNNVAYKNGGYGFQDAERNNSSCTVGSCPGKFINNIGYNNGKGNFAAGPCTAVSHNNIWFSDNGGAKISYKYKIYSSLSAFYKASGKRLDNPNNGNLSSLQVNPKFVNITQFNFKLQTASPAIDNGDPANPGQVKAVRRVDIGAFEAP